MKNLFFLFFALLSTGSHAQQNYMWAGKASGTQTDVGKGLAIDPSGNIIATGTFYTTCDFDPGPGTANRTSNGAEDIFIAKYDQQGNLTWVISFGSNGVDDCKAVRTDAAGNIFVAGGYRGTVDFDPGAGTATHSSSGAMDMFIAKYDTNGNFLWMTGVGGVLDNYANAFDLDTAGNIYVTGQFIGTVDFDPSASSAPITAYGTNTTDIFVAKYDSIGTYQWAFHLGNTSYDGANALRCTKSGDVYVSGYYISLVDFDPSGATADLTNSGAMDGFLAKYSTAGTFTWVIPFSGTQDQVGYCIDLDAQEQPVVGGKFYSTVDFNPSAATYGLTCMGVDDGFVAKYTAAGGFLHAYQLSGNNDCVVLGVKVDTATGEEHITGNFLGLCNFAGTTPVYNLTSTSLTHDIFKASYTSAGVIIQAFRIGNTGQDYGRAIALTASGDAIITGEFNGVCDFDPAAATANLTATGTDIFLAKYGTCTAPSIPVIQPGVASVCQGDSVTFSFTGATLNGATSWQWYSGSCGGVSAGSGTSITVAPATTTTYYVRGEGGCVGSNGACVSVTMTVLANPVLTVSGNGAICNDETALFTANGAANYSWSTGDVGATALLDASDAGTITVYASNASGCMDSTQFNLSVVSTDTSVTLSSGTLTANQSGATYQWIDCGNGQPVAGATSQSFTPTASGNYALVIMNGGCDDTSSCYTMLTTGLTALSNVAAPALYPNPANEFILIGSLSGKSHIELYSADGRKIVDAETMHASMQIDVRMYPAGVYFVKITNGEQVFMQKLVKE